MGTLGPKYLIYWYLDPLGMDRFKGQHTASMMRSSIVATIAHWKHMRTSGTSELSTV